jgi:hypothetical protein
MSTLLLTDRANPDFVIAAPRRTRTRVWARLRAASLDRALAAGASPDASPALSLRAEALIRAGARRDLARWLRRLLDDARRPCHPLSPEIPICRRKVLAAREAMLEAADRLYSSEPVDAGGVAQVRLLITAADGPLHHRPEADDLVPALEAALAALEPPL